MVERKGGCSILISLACMEDAGASHPAGEEGVVGLEARGLSPLTAANRGTSVAKRLLAGKATLTLGLSELSLQSGCGPWLVSADILNCRFKIFRNMLQLASTNLTLMP